MAFMKNFALLFACLLTFSIFSYAIAEEEIPNDPGWSIRPKQQINTIYGEDEEQIWNNEEEQNIEKNYGSDKSPTFMNRNNSSPDYTDDNVDPYNFEE